MQYTCLFGGGAIRGIAHIGVIKALEELNIKTEILGGSSVGSIIATLYAIGYTHKEIADIFKTINLELFRDISFGFNKKFAISKGEVFLDWIRELIEKKYYGENYEKGKSARVLFKDINKKLVIITTDLKTFTCHEFSSFETPDFEIALAIRISCCMPGLMRAYIHNEELLVDGDLQKAKPMWKLSTNLENLKSRILEIRLEGDFSGTDENPIEYVNGMYSCITKNETEFVKSIYGYNDKFDYLVINTGNVVVVDFNYPKEKRQLIMDNGYKQTMQYFKKELLTKKKIIVQIYKDIYKKLLQLTTSLNRKKYIQAKFAITEIFVIVTKFNPYIDISLKNSIIKLQELLESNIKIGLLGFSICFDKEIIITYNSKLKLKLQTRIKELEQEISDLSKF